MVFDRDRIIGLGVTRRAERARKAQRQGQPHRLVADGSGQCIALGQHAPRRVDVDPGAVIEVEQVDAGGERQRIIVGFGQLAARQRQRLAPMPRRCREIAARCVFGGAAVPACGNHVVPRVLPMPRERASNRIEPLRLLRLERTCDRRVDFAAAGPGQAFEYHFERQRMLECIFGNRKGSAFEDEFVAQQRGQRCGQVGRRQARNVMQQRFGKPRANYRRGLQQTSGDRRQTIDTRRDDRAYRWRNALIVVSAGQAITAALTRDHPGFGQRPDHFLDEIGIAAGSLGDRRHQRRKARIAPQQILEQRRDRVVAQRRQRNLPTDAGLHERRAEFGTIIEQQQGAPRPKCHRVGLGVCFNQLFDHRQAGVIDPVQILDQHHRRPVATGAGQQVAQHAGEPALADRGIERRCGALRIGQAKQVKQQWQRTGQLRIERQRTRLDPRARLVRFVARIAAQHRTQHVEHRLERSMARFVRRGTGVDHDVLRAAMFDEFEAQAALAGSGIGHHTQHPTCTRAAFVECCAQSVEVVGAANEGAQPARARYIEA